MSKIFITGISSLLMQQFVSKIADKNHEIIGLSRKPFLLPNVKVIGGDLLQPAAWLDALKGVDILIHAAAITHAFTEEEYFESNLIPTQKLVDAAKASGVKKLVFISTRTACENSGGYGLSKLASEEYIKKNIDNYLIIRPSEIFGGLKNEGIDQIIIDATHKKLMACPVQLDAPLVPIFVEDAIALMKEYIIDAPRQNEIITLNGPERFTVYELIKAVNLFSNNKTAIIPIPRAFMFLIKNIFKITGLKIGFVPDQVDRLYCKKEIATIDYPFKTIKDFVSSIG